MHWYSVFMSSSGSSLRLYQGFFDKRNGNFKWQKRIPILPNSAHNLNDISVPLVGDRINYECDSSIANDTESEKYLIYLIVAGIAYF